MWIRFPWRNLQPFLKELYWLHADRLDAKGILKDLEIDPELRFSFRTAAEKFKIIDDSLYAPVFVRYGEGANLVELLMKKGAERWLLRKLQRYVVNVPRYLLERLKRECVIEEPHPQIFVQSKFGSYSQELGFCYESGGIIEPDDLVV